MKKVQVLQTWGGHLLIPLLSGQEWEQQLDGTWKHRIYRLADSEMQEALKSGRVVELNPL